MRHKIFKLIFLLLVFTFIYFAFSFASCFNKAEIFVSDLKQKLELQFLERNSIASNFKDNIVILSVDDLTSFDLKNHFPNGEVEWPLNRIEWANLIEFIQQGKPRVLSICFAFYNYEDITLSSESSDFILANTLKKYKNIVLGNALSKKLFAKDALLQEDLGQVKPIDKSIVVTQDTTNFVKVPTYFSFLPVPNIFVDNSQMSYINLLVDSDGVVRKSTPISKIVVGNDFYYMPSFAFATFLKYIKYDSKFNFINSQIDFDTYSIPVDKDASNYINWTGESRTYPIIPLSKLIIASELEQDSFKFGKKTYPLSFLEDKIVLIAPTQGRADTFATPVDIEMSIGEINANIIDNYINDAKLDNIESRKFLTKVPEHISFALGVIFSILIIVNIILFRVSFLSFLNTGILFLLYIVLDVISYVYPNLRLDFLTVYPLFAMTSTALLTYVYASYNELSKKRFIKTVFTKKVSKKVLKKIYSSKTDFKSLPKVKNLAVMSCSFSNFDLMYSHLRKEEAFKKLNEVYNIVVDKVHKFNGTVDKSVAEKVIVYWGYPLDVETPCLNAVKSAVEILKEVDIFNSKAQAGDPNVELNISINYGKVTIANVGSSDYENIIIYGNCVDTLSKIDEVSSQFNRRLLISGSTYEYVEDFVSADFAGNLNLTKDSTKIKLYEPKFGKNYD